MPVDVLGEPELVPVLVVPVLVVPVVVVPVVAVPLVAVEAPGALAAVPPVLEGRP